MNYISTRGTAPKLSFDEVLLAGLARDGGLYLPETWPQLSAATIRSFKGRPFAEIAVEVIHPFCGSCISRADLQRMANEAYAGFGDASVALLKQLAPGRYILELFHGPTLAFKDVAMQLLARLMDHALAKRGTRATIVGATSGDTGGAAIEAFRSSKRADVVILFPDGRVSDVQRRMMTTATEANVHAVSVKGTFDDCQSLVKGMFNDHDFRDRVHLSGVNSINWARIVAQVTYYFSAGAILGAPDVAVSFSVPTGNFGDIFAGYVARRMGLPIKQLIIASNENDILPRTVATGTYEMKGVVATSSPSMDIQISSNFERYLFEASGRNAAAICSFMKDLAEKKRFDLGALWPVLKSDFDAATACERQVADCIRDTRKHFGYELDPHTACGFVAADLVGGTGNMVVLATAHPAKFPDAMHSITGAWPRLPDRLASLMTDRERIDVVANDLSNVEAYIERVTAARAKVGP